MGMAEQPSPISERLKLLPFLERNAKKSPLIRLPPEIRNLVYDHIFEQEYQIIERELRTLPDPPPNYKVHMNYRELPLLEQLWKLDPSTLGSLRGQ